jgi:ABC-type dipeptide/oligopeptide/nickel transport system permease subunit
VRAFQYCFNEFAFGVFAGLAIMGAVLGFNMMADGVRDWLDPRGRGTGS